MFPITAYLDWMLPLFKRRGNSAVAKRTEKKNLPADLRIFLEEVGTAVRERLEQMHRDEDRMTTSLTKEGKENEDEDYGGGILPSE